MSMSTFKKYLFAKSNITEMNQNKDQEWKLEIEYNGVEHWFHLHKKVNDKEMWVLLVVLISYIMM